MSVGGELEMMLVRKSTHRIASGPPTDPANGQRRLLGVAIEIGGPITQEFMQSVVSEAERSQFNSVVLPVGMDRGPTSLTSVAPGLDALILISASLAPLASAVGGVPTVILTERFLVDAAFDQVVLESEYAGKRAAEYIASAGRTSVAVVAVKESDSQSLRGFFAGVSNYDLLLSKEHLVYCKASRLDATVIFTSVLRRLTSLPHAIYCDDGDIACGVFEALHMAGIRVPDDTWVIGHGLAALTHSPFNEITTLAPAPEALASTLVGLVSARIGARSQPWAVSRVNYDIAPGATTDFFQIVRPKQ